MRYQDTLRAIGGWLDVRGYREIRIVEEAGALVVEVIAEDNETEPMVEAFRLDRERMARLRQAALSDRGAPRSYPARELVGQEN